MSDWEIPTIETDPRNDYPYDCWHEGTQLLGYWPEGDSYLFGGHSGHTFCISAGFLRRIQIREGVLAK